MTHALRLAERGLYTTQPNPRVGCVIAHGADVVGEGWHQRAGEPHAEVFALRAAASNARGATAYVTLEPCAHFGRTPPCADALIAAGIARVVYASEDPFHEVDGRGAQKLRAAGIIVESGLLRDAARELNRGFFSRIERRRPWLRVKLAQSLDGRTALASGDSKWITGEAARADVQQWRARSSAILTGSGTVFADNPRLTVRLEPLSLRQRGRGEGSEDVQRRSAPESSSGASRHLLPEGEGKSFKPLRIVLDSGLRTPPGAHLLDGEAPTLVLHADSTKPGDDRFAQVELACIAADADGWLDLHAALRLCAERGVNELQVEAGPTLCGALVAAGLVDELLLYVAPVILGDQGRPLLTLPSPQDIATGQRWRVIDQRQVGNDLRLLLRE